MKLGYVRMQLAPASGQLQSYTRDWFFEPDGRRRLVDTIKSRDPHRFTWLFHTYRKHPITAKGNGAFTIQNDPEIMELRLDDTVDRLRRRHADCSGLLQPAGQQRLPSPRVRDA